MEFCSGALRADMLRAEMAVGCCGDCRAELPLESSVALVEMGFSFNTTSQVTVELSRLLSTSDAMVSVNAVTVGCGIVA